MAEKIIIGEFNIDIDAVTADAAKTRKAIEDIKNEQKELVKQGKSSDEAFVRNAITLRGLNKDYNAQLKLIDQAIASTDKNVDAQDRLNAVLNREVRSIEELRAQTSEMTKLRNQVNTTTEEGRAYIEQLNNAIDKNNSLIKENVSEFEQQKIGIGGYADGIREALGETGLFDRETKTVQNTLKNFTPIFTTISTELKGVVTGFKTADGAGKLFTATLKLLRVALIATGIGAIVVALGSMVAYLRGSQEGVDRLNRVLVPLKTVLSGILGVIQDLGKAIIDAFTNPKQFINDLIEQIKPLGNLIGGILTGNIDMIKEGFIGVKDQVNAIKDGISGIVDQSKEWWGVGVEIQKLNEQINESELNMIKNQARLKREINENRDIARDMSRSAADRNKAAQESIRLAQELRDIELNHLDLKIEKLKLEQSTSASTHADMKEMAELEAERDEIASGHAQLMIHLNSNLNSARKKGADDDKKAAQERIKSMNEENALIAAQQGIRAKSLDEQLAFEQQMSDRRKAIFDEELKAKLISQTEYDTRILEMQNELAQKQSEIVVQNAQRELAQQDNRLEVERKLSEAVGEERIKLEEKQLKDIQEARARYEAIRFSEGLISEQEYLDAIANINHQAAVRQAELDKDRRDLERKLKSDQFELDFETEMNALEARNADLFEIESFQIEQDRERRLEAARQRYTDEAMLAQAILNINTESDYLQAQLAIEKDRTIMESRAALAGAIAKLVGEETAIGKAAAITEATINTYLGATQALASLPPPASYIAMAATIATGLSSVAKIAGIGGESKKPQTKSAGNTAISGQKTFTLNAIPPFATGGLVTGGLPIKRSNGDNVLASLKIGEVVLNKSQQMALGGDAVFRSLGVPGFASGGLVGGSGMATVQNSISKKLDTQMAEVLGNAVRDGSRAGTEQGSRQGIVDLSTERYIQDLSSF